MKILRAALLGSILTGLTALAEDAATKALDQMELAVDLFEMQYYEDAHTILSRVQRRALPPEGQRLMQQFGTRIEQASGAKRRAERQLNEATLAFDAQRTAEGGAALLSVIRDPLTPDELRGQARQKLADLAPATRELAMQAAARPDRAPAINHVRTARDMVDQGWQALAEGNFEQAQDLFNKAWWHVPNAPSVAMYANPREGFVLDQMPMGGVRHIRLWAKPKRYVTTNLQLGVGRLLGMNTFQFSDAPVSGVGASGFVQLPNISRIQLKTTVTAPVYDMPAGAGNSYTSSQEYLVLVRPAI